MRLFLLILISLVSFSFWGLPISARFFPNTSSVLPSLIPNVSWGPWNDFQNFGNCHHGQKIDGLAKLKKYFQYFGYVGSNSFANFTDDFDDVLESAIRTYQLNFNLNATGQLDEQTLRQIVRPRCGVADVINGSSTMNSGRAPKSTHVHTVAHYSFFPGRPRWPSGKTQLTYAFQPDNQLGDSTKALFARAFTKWSEVTPLTFEESTSFLAADIKIGFFSGDHGDGEPFDGPFGTLAHAFSPPSGRFHLDNDENWVVDGQTLTDSDFDMESVAVHEIGHLLGLGHSSVDDSIMFPTLSTGTRKVNLAGDDIQGIQELYGSNPNFRGSTSSTTPPGQERDTSGTHIEKPFWQFTILVAVCVISLAL